VQVFQRLRDAVRRKRRDKWQGEWFLPHDNASSDKWQGEWFLPHDNAPSDKWQGEWFLPHDNAPSDTSPVVQQFLAEKNISVMTQPQYTPEFAPSDFCLFPALKMSLKETHFATMEDIKWNATSDLWKTPKEAFRRCFQQWQNRWSKFVCARVLL
jgi:hypothetical protein